MQINVSNLKQTLNKYISSLEKYKNNINNLYNELNQTEKFWTDGHSVKFFKDVSLNKVKMETMQSELNDVQEVYNYFIGKYESIGNKIFFDLDNKNRFINKIDNLTNQIKNVINMYRSLDLSFCSAERSMLQSERQILNNNLNYLSDIKEKNKRLLNEIEEIEKNIKLKLSKISIEIIKENDLKEYLGDIK